jgi:hydroxymethylbilane synthase
VAVAALDRLGLRGEAAEVLEPEVLLPQAAQGALAVECRADDADTLALLAAIDDAGAHAAVDAERGFLEQLGGGCNLPCGALAVATPTGMEIEALLASLDGRVLLRAHATGSDPAATGRAVAARLLDDHGGRILLEDVA